LRGCERRPRRTADAVPDAPGHPGRQSRPRPSPYRPSSRRLPQLLRCGRKSVPRRSAALPAPLGGVVCRNNYRDERVRPGEPEYTGERKRWWTSSQVNWTPFVGPRALNLRCNLACRCPSRIKPLLATRKFEMQFVDAAHHRQIVRLGDALVAVDPRARHAYKRALAAHRQVLARPFDHRSGV
jgi:hypothetical protein